MGLQLLFFCFSMRASWVSLFESDPTQPVSRDLSEAVLNAHSHFVPRLGWLIEGGADLGLSEPTDLNITLVLLFSTGFLLVIGLFSRSAAVASWFLHLCAVKSANLMTYGVDNFATIGLFYLMFAPLPDRFALDYVRKKLSLPNHSGTDVCQRVLQLHICIVYFFSGLTKSLGIGWWNGTSFWRAITSPPFDVIQAHTWAILTPALPLLGIGVWVLEIGYPVFIWLRRTRLIWFLGVIAMHVAIGLTMGLYLFAFVMIVLNFAAFGPNVFPFLDKITPSKAGI